MKIRKGDNVIMLGGKDKGKKGKIIHVFPDEGTLVVEGLNLIKKHLRARKQGQKGQVVSKERAVHASAVALVCKSCGQPTRIGFQVEGDSKRRVCKKCKVEV